MRDVDSAVPAGYPGQLNDFIGRRERSGHIKQTGAKSECPIFHPLLYQRSHFLELIGVRVAIRVADDRCTNGALADKTSDVYRLRQRLELFKKRFERNRRRAVWTCDESR